DLSRVLSGGDPRTTLMVRNIPNKYTQKMLLAAVDGALAGGYDFFYLPIDFKNKCNVGYAFINVTKPALIEPLVRRFHGKRWDRFNSEKVCAITYARIQGKAALVAHFQHSSLL
uniref:RNA-binding protein n=1 Tax=Salmonella enterica TaxID=28901 RepID=UPI003524939B